MRWRRIDLCLSADPWDPIPLRRCRRRANFFHGLAGKYDLDAPDHLPIGFDIYDRIAFINADRMHRYLERGIVSRERAVLVGYPKVAALVNAGFNVIVKLHDRSLAATQPKFSGGVDWRARFARIHVPGRIAFVETADASPLLAASDVVVTDHSSIGFEFLLLDRPLLVFDAPDLTRAAQLDPAAVARLRSAARVVRDAGAVGAAAADEIDHPERLSNVRRAVARDTFYEPGTATERALAVVYEMLDLP